MGFFPLKVFGILDVGVANRKSGRAGGAALACVCHAGEREGRRVLGEIFDAEAHAEADEGTLFRSFGYVCFSSVASGHRGLCGPRLRARLLLE